MQKSFLTSIGLIIIIGLSIWLFGQNLSNDLDNVETTSEQTDTDGEIVVRVSASETTRPATTTPQSPDGPKSYWFYSTPITIPDDTFVTGFSVEMENTDVSVLHHTSVGVLGRPATICGEHFAQEGGMFEIFSASRNTLDPVILPEPYGIFIKAGEQISVEFMMHAQAAPHGAHEETEGLNPTLVVKLNTDTNRTAPVSFARLRLDDTPCQAPLSHQAFMVPTTTPDTSYTKTAENNEESASLTFTEPSTVIVGGANLWPRKGGQTLDVFIDERAVQSFTAEPGDTDYKWNIPFSYETISIPANSTVHISATYKNPFQVQVKDAAGMYGFYYTTN